MRPTSRTSATSALVVIAALGLFGCKAEARPSSGGFFPTEEDPLPAREAGVGRPDTRSGDEAAVEAGTETSVASDAGELDAAPGAPDLGPPLEVDVIESKPGSDTVCTTDLAWWTTETTIDSTVSTAAFATEMNALFATGEQHAISMADDSESGPGLFVASATVTGGDFQQHFPEGKSGTRTSRVRSLSGFTTPLAQAIGWMKVRDASGTDVFVPLQSIVVEASYGDTLCQTLVAGRLDAVIPASGAGTTIATAGGNRTLASMLGAETSMAPAGWKVRFAFKAQKVGVSFK